MATSFCQSTDGGFSNCNDQAHDDKAVAQCSPDKLCSFVKFLTDVLHFWFPAHSPERHGAQAVSRLYDANRQQYEAPGTMCYEDRAIYSEGSGKQQIGRAKKRFTRNGYLTARDTSPFNAAATASRQVRQEPIRDRFAAEARRLPHHDDL
jgi:hypothetical protein